MYRLSLFLTNGFVFSHIILSFNSKSENTSIIVPICSNEQKIKIDPPFFTSGIKFDNPVSSNPLSHSPKSIPVLFLLFFLSYPPNPFFY
jgi:hypothetical protein